MEDGTNRLRSSQKGTTRSGLSDTHCIFVCSPGILYARLANSDRRYFHRGYIQKKIVEEEKNTVQEVDEDSKASENGDAKETKENGSNEEKEESEAKEAESTENGDSTDAPVDSCCIKRKSTALSETEETADDDASPEKKTRLDEKCAETESNGEAEATA
ncbi:hypothetical protein WH47_09291 [Habropoda laboriosa]|uniref:Uncharacterized protein n=1 Tax=Habropoda laboriosa TaxID=597456 RepID=A0A0L7R969_9HYME|nr:hypothetical protein WH47_09291 [Habropoda laboriosa]